MIGEELTDKFELGEGIVMAIEDMGDNLMMVLNKRILFEQIGLLGMMTHIPDTDF